MVSGTPRGFRDILPREALARERISGSVRDCFAAHGYLPVETPLLEVRGALERGGRIKGSPFQLFDVDGSLLTLRPDLTLPVARLVANRVAADELPARFRYAAPVVREESSLKGQPRQFTQLGVELGVLEKDVSALFGVFCVNYMFTYPYWQFDMTLSGYPLTFASMLIVSILISTLTTQIKQQEKLRPPFPWTIWI